MNTLSQPELQPFLENAAIAAASPESRIGRELRYHLPAPRTVVIHFGGEESADYISQIISILLSSEESWLLLARYGPAARLGDLTKQPEAQALVFGPSERDRLCMYLCTRDMAMGSVSQDVYLVGADGNVLARWDHHTADEGLTVDLRDVKQASRLLADLNMIGAELEVFYTDR
jgi:hypothetical protein